MTYNRSDITFVISAFGEGALQTSHSSDPFTPTLKNSIKKIYPNCDIIVSCNELSINRKKKINNQIIKLRKKSKFLDSSPGSLKLVTHMEAWNYIKTKWVVFLDNDMLLLKPIHSYLDNKTDYIFTWRKNDMSKVYYPWLNAGTMICRNNAQVKMFWKKYYKKMLDNAFKKKVGDQFGFVELLPKFNKSINQGKKLIKIPKSKIIKFNEKSINFKAVNVEYLNHVYSLKKINQKTSIVHFKGLLGTIITKTKKDKRYLKFLLKKIFMSQNSIKILASKIKLWKKFAPKNIANKVIDL